MIKTLSKRAGFVLAVAGAAVVGGAATALVSAAIPSSNDGNIHACYRNGASLVDAKGSLRVIDSDAGQNCTAQETALNWNKTGAVSELPSLVGADLRSQNLSLRDFKGYNFSNADFEGSTAKYSNFSGANFTNASLGFDAGHSIFRGAIFTGTNLQTGVHVDGADFTNTDLSSQVLTSFYAENAIFTGTNLSNVQFISAFLTGSNLSTANLTGATWSYTVCPDNTNSESNGHTCVGHLVP